MPRYEGMHWTGLDFPRGKFDELQRFNACSWQSEVIGHADQFIDLHDHLPPEMIYGSELLISRLQTGRIANGI